MVLHDGTRIALSRLLVVLQWVGDGCVEVVLEVFGLVIALFSFAIAQLERARAPIVPTPIPSGTILEGGVLLVVKVQ